MSRVYACVCVFPWWCFVQLNLELPVERILLQTPLTSYGNFLVRLALAPDTVQTLKVSVVPR